jgi:hypothetical protein
MEDWTFAQRSSTEELARLHYFTMKKRQEGAEILFKITVHEYATANQQSMQFFAEADKPINQKTAPFVPCGWGNTLLTALTECMKAIHRFPYEPEAEAK